MGKKSKYKKIRKLAAQLPEIMETVISPETQIISGADLIKDGVTEVKGKPVNPQANYTKRPKVQRPINHVRKMKKLFNQYGAMGVGVYLNAVDQHQANLSNIQLTEEETTTAHE